MRSFTGDSEFLCLYQLQTLEFGSRKLNKGGGSVKVVSGFKMEDKICVGINANSDSGPKNNYY